MKKLYDDFFDTCKLFDKILQEEKWKNTKNKSEFKSIVDSEFCFWKRVLSYLPPEKRLIKEFSWLTECYKQIQKNLDNEPVNWKVRWLQDDQETI